MTRFAARVLGDTVGDLLGMNLNDLLYPQYEESWTGGPDHGLLRYYHVPVRYTLLRDPAGVWTKVRFPTTEQLLSASFYVRGGYDVDIPDEYVDELVAAVAQLDQ